MNALVQLDPRALGEPLAPEIERARRYVAAAQAAATERAYRIGWNDFCAWCAFRRAEPLPAHPAAVAMYLSFLADRGLAAASIGQRAAAIAHRHRGWPGSGRVQRSLAACRVRHQRGRDRRIGPEDPGDKPA